MEVFINATTLLSVLALGLMAGALVAEGAILVRFWRSVPPEVFLSWYKRNAALLQNFFGPLEIAAAVLTIAAAALTWIGHRPGRELFAASALFGIAVLAAFPLYFQRANASFATGTIAVVRVAEELRRWSAWHWVRTVLAIIGFACAAAACRA